MGFGGYMYVGRTVGDCVCVHLAYRSLRRPSIHRAHTEYPFKKTLE